MKKYLLIIAIAFSLAGCSTMEIEAAASSDDITQSILAKGLSHEENLNEAAKLGDSHLVKIVTLKIKNDRDKKIQAQIDEEKSEVFAKKVKISDDGDKYESEVISESLQSGILSTDVDFLDYYFEGNRDKKTEVVEHNFHLSLLYNSKESRKYSKVSFCDQWNNCDEGFEINIIEVSGSNCKKDKCNFKEDFNINLTDDFLKSTLKNGFSMKLISKDKTSSIKIPKAFLMGYLKVAQ